MTRPPHVTRRYLPPEEPPQESLAMALLGLVAIGLALFFAVVLLPVWAA